MSIKHQKLVSKNYIVRVLHTLTWQKLTNEKKTNVLCVKLIRKTFPTKKTRKFLVKKRKPLPNVVGKPLPPFRFILPPPPYPPPPLSSPSSSSYSLSYSLLENPPPIFFPSIFPFFFGSISKLTSTIMIAAWAAWQRSGGM